MILRSEVRDCLFLNWAVPRSELPSPPDPLRYQVHEHDGERWVYLSALLFRQRGVRLATFPWPRLSYPQMNLRFYALDADDVPAVLFRAMWVPAWVVPAVRLIGRQRARAAALRFPARVDTPERPYGWRAKAGHELMLKAASGTPRLGPGPRLGSWEETVAYFRQRPRGYIEGPSGLRRVETSHVSTAVWPMEVELQRGDLLAATVPLERGWPPLHSAWLCPELEFEFELAPAREAPLPEQVPAAG
ncbi:MAG: DUF2071 domain-containing protein [Thermoanaerobaculia bacterium]|nr:DUF2071 domain-containing protein [Thermoanaerobaculia bacterium]